MLIKNNNLTVLNSNIWDMPHRVIQKITVDKNGKVDVYLKLLNDIELKNTFDLTILLCFKNL